MTERLIIDARARHILKSKVAEVGGVRAAARALGVHPGWICNAIAGRCTITGKLAEWTGLKARRVVIYEVSEGSTK